MTQGITADYVDHGKWGELSNSGKPRDMFMMYLLREWAELMNPVMCEVIANKAREIWED